MREWIAENGFESGLAIKSGNGGGLLLPIPPTPPEPEFIAKVAAFLKLVRKETNCDVDTTTFDPPRVCGILQTWNAKFEDEGEGRKNHIRESIGNIPTRDENHALVDFIDGLDPDPEALSTWTKKYNEPTASKPTTQKAPTEDNGGADIDYVNKKLKALLEGDSKLRSLIDWSEDEQQRHNGDRSAAEFGLVGKLVTVGFSDPQIDWIMCNVSRIGKWAEEGDHYRYEMTLRRLRENEATKAKGAADLLADLTERYEKDKNILKDPAIQDALIKLRDEDPLEYDIVTSGLRGVKARTLKKSLELRERDKKAEERADEPACEYPTDIIERAWNILEYGNPIAFLLEQYHRNHRGDDNLGVGWYCSFASGQSLTSNGIQPSAHSEDPGMGKTDSGKSAFYCLHVRRDLETSVSAMSLYRDKSLEPGDIIFSDDVEWSNGLTSTVKRVMSNFQRETHHTTLDKQNELQKYALPPRLMWWFTSVESSGNDQIVDRQFLFDVDNSEDHHQGVNDDIKHRRASFTTKFEVDDDILTARSLSYTIKENGPYKVNIPFADWIDRKLPRGHRDLNRFLDLIDALAILRYPQRDPQKDDDGVIRLTANIQDFQDAKAIFTSRQKNIRTHLTNAETRLLIKMTERSVWTQADLVDATGFKQGTISKRLLSLLEKTNYIKFWMEKGEKRYATTDKVDLSIFCI